MGSRQPALNQSAGLRQTCGRDALRRGDPDLRRRVLLRMGAQPNNNMQLTALSAAARCRGLDGRSGIELVEPAACLT
jgi:hypothetical protein